MDSTLSRDSQEEVDSEAESSTSNKTVFLEKVRQSNAACQSGDFLSAVKLYTEAISLDPSNHVLYSNRSAAYIKLGKYVRALQDAIKARELNPKWPKAYYRQGVALQYLGRHADALAAFASGLAQDTKSIQLLAGLVEAAMKSPLRATLEPTYRQLQTMKLDKSPFVITSVIGQELLAAGHHAASVVVLESALRIGTCSLKLRGSVFSALSSAYWALNTLDKAIAYMQQDLAVAKSLGDQVGECRAHGNLGSAYFSKGNFKEALSSHRYQLVLAMKCKDTQAAAWALTSLGHVYTAIGDFPNALASHKQCVQLVRQINDRLQEAREIGNVGAVYLAMGDFDKAVECHLEHLRLAKQLGNKVEEARAYSNLGSSHHFRRSFEQAITFHNHVLHIAQELGDKSVEARAYAGLGHAARCMGDYQQAKKWHEKQLEMALSTKDKVTEGRACSNLGIVYHLLRDFDAALKLHQAHLNIASASGDRAGMGRAYGNIGNAFSAMGQYEQAIKFHKQELTISKEVNDRNAEASTHGNLAVAYQALGMYEMALLHYHSHLSIARELKDTAGEACALCNLGNCHSSRGEFAQAVPYYESFLQLSQETSDLESEAKACHFLGYAHYCLGNYKEAISYYERDLSLAKDLQDRLNMGRAYCNLGLSHLALGNYPAALECQKYFLAVAQMTKHIQGIFRALGNLGDVLTKMNNASEAVKMYQKQLIIAKKSQDKSLEAAAYGALGLCHRQMKNYDKALAYHTQELKLRQELNDLKGECKAHGHLGAAHMSLGNYIHAVKCYEEHLERARELQDCSLETQALGNLGIARLNMRHFEDAIGFFEQQLALLEQLGTATALVDKGRAYGSLGDCYDALGDFEEAIKCHEQFLAIALKSQSLRDQERAYRSLANSHLSLGHLQQALVCFEKRLVVSHELGSIGAKAMAYGELGNIHSQLGNFEQSISCLEHQMALAKELKDRQMEANAACGLGTVYQQMGEHEQSLHYHQLDLSIAEETGNMSAQGRAYGNLGVAHESLGKFEQAITCQEQHLSIAAQINDKTAKILAYSSLGRIHHAIGNTTKAVTYLQQGLQIAEQVGQREDEAKIRYRLGLALWGNSELEGAQQQLYRAADLFESIRREARGPTDYKLSLFDLQTASYQALQRVLVNLNRHEEALVVAERGRTRAFVDLLLERQTANLNSIVSFSPNSVDQMLDIINRQKASVIYYSIAAGYLYTWVIVPNKGIVTFHETSVSDVETDKTSEQDASFPLPSSLLEQYVTSVREALGVDALTGGQETGAQSETESEAGDFWQQHLEELGDRLNQESDRTGFLRMVNRNHLFNSSNYSLSSLFSLGSLSGSVASGSTSRPGSVGSRRHQWQGPAPLHALYNLLIAPIEEFLPNEPAELLLVLDGDLFLVPFAMLKNENGDDYLCERYSLIRIPSISALKNSQRSRVAQRQNNTGERLSAVVVGNPYLPSVISEQWGWNDIPHAQSEADLVSEMLGTKPVVGSQATKEAVLAQLSQAECIHLATHVSWKLSAIVFSPGEYAETSSRRFPGNAHSDSANDPGEYQCEPSPELASTTDIPPLSEFLLTAADILNLQLSALLVVISSCHTRSHHGRAHSDGVVGLTRALLAAGAQCVLVSLWPVPDTALKLLYRTFYSSLLQGSCVSVALADAMRTIQATRHFSHPANWASFLLVGSDVRLNSQVALMGQALGELLKAPDACRDALRVVLHLVEKSLQRIHRGHKNAMYTTQKSIENKVGPVKGWKELLISVGFRFEPASNGLPACVFFPQTDPGERLTQCSASLQALLGLSSISLTAISKLLSSPDYAEDIIQLMQQVIAQSSKKDLETEYVECPVSVRLWSVPGCHELLASLGFDLMEVGRDGVILRMGKQANRRVIQFALQALLAVFDTSEAPKSICFEESSSMESLESIPSNSCTPTVYPPAPTVPYPPRLKLSNISLGKGSGAFSCYVRSRGEPDGRTGSEQKGRESDTFTPSPVDTVSKSYNMVQNAGDSLPGMATSRAAADAHRNASQSSFTSGGLVPGDTSSKRPDSSSSASSATEWDSGQSTVRRQNILRSVGLSSKHSSHIRGSVRNPTQDHTALKSGSLEIYQSPWCPDFQNNTTCKSSFLPQEKFSSIIRAPQTALRTIFGFKDKAENAGERHEKLHQSCGNQAKETVMADVASQNAENAGAKSDSEGSHSSNRKVDSLDGVSAQTASLASSKETGSASQVPSFDSIKLLPNISRFNKSISKRSVRNFEYPSRELCGHLEERTLQDTYATSRLRQLSHESPISDVYHDRSFGLGLAPSLSTILTSDGWDKHQGSPDQCLQNNHECGDIVPKTHTHSSSSSSSSTKKSVWSIKKPLVPSGFGHLSCWNNLSLPNNEKDKLADGTALDGFSDNQMESPVEGSPGMFLNDIDIGSGKSSHVRDEGDGRSVKEMSCPDQPDMYRESRDGVLSSSRGQKDCYESLGLAPLKDCFLSEGSAFSAPGHSDILGDKDKAMSYSGTGTLLAPDDAKGEDTLILHHHHLSHELEKLSLAERQDEMGNPVSDSETSDADSGISQRVSIATVRRNPKGMASTLNRPRAKRDKSPMPAKYPDGKPKT